MYSLEGEDHMRKREADNMENRRRVQRRRRRKYI